MSPRTAYITAVTALEHNGEIELVASNEVSTGPGSITSPPISTSKETADQSFIFEGGTINIAGPGPLKSIESGDGRQTDCELRAHLGPIRALSTMTAQNRVYLENGSSINVNGSWITEAAAANTTQVQLNSVNLRDYPDQKGGILQGATVTVNNLLGSSIGDISGSLTTQQLTALQRSLQGGKINIASQGDVIVKQGASVDFDGGGHPLQGRVYNNHGPGLRKQNLRDQQRS